jgi:hypothetical protein
VVSCDGGHAVLWRICVCSDMSRCFGLACEHMNSFVVSFVCTHAQFLRMEREVKHQLRLVEKTAQGHEFQITGESTYVVHVDIVPSYVLTY